MKSLKKMFALVIAMVMVLGLALPAMAADVTPDPTSAAPVAYDKPLTVTGLTEGDSVNFYKVIQWVDNADGNVNGWKATDTFASVLTKPVLTEVLLGHLATQADVDANIATAADIGKKYVGATGITAALAGQLAAVATSAGQLPDHETVLADNSGVATITNTSEGMWMALVTPISVDTVYNPAFVSADYVTDKGGTVPMSTDKTYSDTAMVKKETVELSKEITGTSNGTDTAGDTPGNTKYDVDLGDDVEFTITSKVPAYSSAYQEPVYEITDTMESGLALKTIPTVTIENVTLAAGDYTVTPSSIDDSTEVNTFTVALTASGLAKVAATGVSQNITLTYTATVKSLENFTVTEKENEATVKFSNKPEDKTSYSLLEDKTRNYTFTIDGNLLGYTGTSYETDELIKIGTDAAGNPITQTTKYRSGTTWSELSPLAGATFGLYTSLDDANNATENYYTNSGFNGTVDSDATGRLKIAGLDAGTYYLKELKAPTGFVKDGRTFKIVINATYTTIPAGSYQKNVGTEAAPKMITVKYNSYEVLKGYTVAVSNANDANSTATTSTYNISNKGETDHKVVDKATYQTITGEDFAGDAVTPINNTQGTELPSTGGMGTTIFYIIGAVLVLAAGIVLVTRKRMSSN